MPLSDHTDAELIAELKARGLVAVPRFATDKMAAYAKHRNPGVSESLAKGVWCCMVDQVLTEQL